MPAQDYAELTLEADADGDGSTETGVFVMAGNLSVQPGIRTGFILGGQGSRINNLIGEYIEQTDEGEVSELSQRRAFYADAGGGEHIIEIEGRSWEGAIYDESGEPAQWGNTSSETRSQASATGQPPQTQMDVLMRYLTVGSFDSRSPATFEYGEYSSEGLYSPIDVVLEGPRIKRAADEGEWIDFSMTLIAAASLEDAVDAVQNDER